LQWPHRRTRFSNSPATTNRRRVGKLWTHFQPLGLLIWTKFWQTAWLTGAFSVADIRMSDVLRLVDRFDGLAEHPACRAYVERATARPAFKKAHADQIEQFEAAD
jgi:glutathione S-transferase